LIFLLRFEARIVLMQFFCCSCGRCGYDLKLSSLARDTAGMVGAGARKRRGGAAVVVFDAIDDARFGHLDEFRCLDVQALRA
jgi:hypothetical protein